ncbi:hypothetical protein ACIQZB_44010 [Streptomyces sp. NPDC097727]|uniref:hypothetical protein n=1 Tax=Streptomyces sp. NPDC097727 TaxID=3366092 RepID=UPI00382F1D8A
MAVRTTTGRWSGSHARPRSLAVCLQAGLDDDGFDEEYEEAFTEEGEGFDDPTRIVHNWRKSMEFTDLIAVCQGFIAGAARLVPKLR